MSSQERWTRALRIARWMAGAVTTLVLLGIAAVLIATQVVNPDRYRGVLERAVTRATGQSLVIAGHLRLGWFPWVSLRVGAARLESPPGTPGPDLIDWQSARVQIRCLPLLLHRQVELGRIRLRGARIHLVVDAEGRGNWQGLIARLRGSASGSAGPAAAPALPQLAGLALRDSALSYRDARTGERYRLTGWQLTLGAVRTGRPVALATRFVLAAPRLPPAGIPVAFSAERLALAGAPIALSTRRLTLQVADAHLVTSARVTGAPGALAATGALSGRVASVRGLLAALGVHAPLPADPTALGALRLAAGYHYRDGALTVKPLTLTLDATRLTGWVERVAGPHPLWRFRLRGNDIDFDRYLPASRAAGRFPRLPERTLEALSASGSLELARATWRGVRLHALKLEVR